MTGRELDSLIVAAAERSGELEFDNASTFGKRKPNYNHALPVPMGIIRSWPMRSQVSDISFKRCRSRQNVLTPGIPSHLQPTCPPSLPISLTVSSNVGGVSGKMGAFVSTLSLLLQTCFAASPQGILRLLSHQ